MAATHPVERQYVARMVRAARSHAGLSLRALAERCGTSHPTVADYESGRKVPSSTTLLRILKACGQHLDVGPSPRLPLADRAARGRELAEVLDLASKFPARHADKMPYPRFGITP